MTFFSLKSFRRQTEASTPSSPMAPVSVRYFAVVSPDERDLLPDGRRISFCWDDGGPYDGLPYGCLYLMNTDGSGLAAIPAQRSDIRWNVAIGCRMATVT